MDIVFAHELSEEALAKLQEIKQDLKSAGVGERVLNNLEYGVISDLAELREELQTLMTGLSAIILPKTLKNGKTLCR